MATVPSKHHHQPLHNFSLPFLKWGHRLQSNHHCRRRHRTSPPQQFSNNIKPETDDETGNSSGKLIDVDVETTAVNGDGKPWNLRPRRYLIDTFNSNGNGSGSGSGSGNGALVVASAKLGRTVRGVSEEEEQGKKKKKNRRLWISLSKEEIEEDIYAFTGSKPVRRPKKRSKIAQKQVDNVFPGLYLVGVSAESYRV